MRRACWLLILLPLLVACTGGGGGYASCVAPYLDDQAPGDGYDAPIPTLRPGATFDVYGHWYTSTCNDTGGNDPLAPLPDVELSLTLPDGRVQQFGRYTPGGPDLGFRAAVRIPRNARPGIATVSDNRPQPATFRFEIGGG